MCAGKLLSATPAKGMKWQQFWHLHPASYVAGQTLVLHTNAFNMFRQWSICL